MFAGTFRVKAGLAQMLKGGIIMDVINAEEARIAEKAGVRRILRPELKQPAKKNIFLLPTFRHAPSWPSSVSQPIFASMVVSQE